MSSTLKRYEHEGEEGKKAKEPLPKEARWRVYGKDTVACKLSRADLPGWLLKKVAVGPNEGAIIVRDGRAEELISQASVQTTAGLLDSIAGWFGLGSDVDVYFVDLSPIDFTIYLGESTRKSVTTSVQTASRTEEHEHLPKIDFVRACEQVGWLEQGAERSARAGSVNLDMDVSALSIVAVSADHEVVRAECLVRLQVAWQDAQRFISLLKGKVAISRWDLAAMVRNELLARVLIPQIAAHRVDELRGNRELLRRIEQEVTRELGQTLQSCGLFVASFTINWGLTEQEMADIARKQIEREDEATKFAHGRELAQMQRVLEIDRTRLDNLQQLKVAETQGDEQLRNLYLGGEIQRDLMVEGKRVDTARIDAQIREIELGIEKQEGALRVQQRRDEEMLRLEIEDSEFKQRQAERLAQSELQDREMWSTVKAQIEMATAKHDRIIAQRRQESEARFREQQAEIDRQYQQRKLKLDESRDRMGMLERLISQGMRGGKDGVVDASVLNTLLVQATEQEYATVETEKVQARAAAAAAKNNLDTFKEAEDRERQHQRGMVGLSADMMQAAKQMPPTTIVTGPSMGGMAYPPTVQVMNSAQTPPAAIPVAIPSDTKCMGCGATLQPNWKACPACGATHAKQPSKCIACGGDVQPGWKACPNCGKSLAEGPHVCPQCAKPVQKNWRACPECGQALG
ncbi:MAG: zinc ribbon domain-containing protein [Planctomycetota bacterium]|nr:zinc ribbon domain-containing protein [Planctomycetota bacterium]